MGGGWQRASRHEYKGVKTSAGAYACTQQLYKRWLTVLHSRSVSTLLHGMVPDGQAPGTSIGAALGPPVAARRGRTSISPLQHSCSMPVPSKVARSRHQDSISQQEGIDGRHQVLMPRPCRLRLQGRHGKRQLSHCPAGI